ncbi:MAG TPA: undecaprenyldiphospho-muramoylpentapeptide beta-N-acetylglucosaminyltransferase [Candidatus Omnitrophota bacterium]|nr:undecaprenyldiphospho-muramoylpentapeptide beta-N-acetylglucosaminyltransferase [Candidatus Omnitrophota bacterium]
MRILIATGSSGGHIFPALALMEALKNSKQEVLLVLPQKARENKIPVSGAELKYIHAANLSFNLSRQNISGLWFFLLGAGESLRIILKFRPEVAVGFGSLNTVALMFWAWLFRIKTVIHEQNVICGRANKLLAKLVDKVAVSFEQTRRTLNIDPAKIVLTGNPLRRDLTGMDKKTALDFFKFKEGKFTILVTGGSQGSHRLNAVCLEVLSAYCPADNLQVIHISGKQDYAWLSKRYAGLALTSRIFEFFPQMQYAYSSADLVICRAGATTIAELEKFKIPAILVPYPFAYAHQLANARVLEKAGGALIISDQELAQDRLKFELGQLLADPGKLNSMRQGYGKFPEENAACSLAKEILAVV